MNFISWQKMNPKTESTGNLILVFVYSQHMELVLHNAHFQLKAYLFPPQLFYLSVMFLYNHSVLRKFSWESSIILIPTKYTHYPKVSKNNTSHMTNSNPN